MVGGAEYIRSSLMSGSHSCRAQSQPKTRSMEGRAWSSVTRWEREPETPEALARGKRDVDYLTHPPLLSMRETHLFLVNPTGSMFASASLGRWG